MVVPACDLFRLKPCNDDRTHVKEKRPKKPSTSQRVTSDFDDISCTEILRLTQHFEKSHEDHEAHSKCGIGSSFSIGVAVPRRLLDLS